MRTLAVGVVLTITMAAPSPVHAQAPIGWILWEKNMANKPGSLGSVTWEPLDGYEAIDECRKQGQELLKAAVAYMNSGAGKLLGPIRPDGRRRCSP